MNLLHITSFELKRNLRIFLIWTVAWIAMILLLLPFYDTFSSDNSDFGKLFEELPDAFKVAFNIDANTLSTITGYINTELVELLILCASIFGAYIGIRTIAKEISNKSLLFVVTKPVNRMTIFYGKALSTIILTILSNITLFVTLAVGVELFTTSNSPNEYIFFAFLVVTIYQLLYFSLGLLLGIVIEEGPGLGIGIMTVVLTFVINIISNLSKDFDFLRFVTPYFYLDLSPLISGGSLDNYRLVFMAMFIIIFLLLGSVLFDRRDIDT
jgi:ABC-2 type transport system permease protein